MRKISSPDGGRRSVWEVAIPNVEDVLEIDFLIGVTGGNLAEETSFLKVFVCLKVG
jgi:hypothetical protein